MISLLDFFLPRDADMTPMEKLDAMIRRSLEAERAGFHSWMARMHGLAPNELAERLWQEWYLIHMYFTWKERK